MSELKKVIEESFTQYGGAVLQSRALVDVRDGMKPSARQIFYSMFLNKLVHKNPFKKTNNAIGLAMADFYIHGDSSAEGIIMRAGQSFAMRYPLVDVKGISGNLIASGNWAAPRYTESRLSELSNYLFSDIDKKVIEEWRDNYDDTKQYPAILPSKGFYNIVNGTLGIGIGMACSIPQFNLKELNNALIYLIDHPDCSFEDIYCAPDFATGAILLNESQVKDSLKNGQGFACKLRSVVEFDSKDRCFVVTEIPYGVYTNTICEQLNAILESEDNPGIERYNDLTGSTPLIKIYLSKKANPDKILKFLYKNTSLEDHYGINLTMLDNGRYPRIFTWKEALQAHIDHEKVVYRKGYEYDKAQIEHRLHIIEGLLICIANIEEVIQVIKNSTNTAAAAKSLQSRFVLSEEQAKAVLDIKLSRLAHLEVEKLENEKTKLIEEDKRINDILNTPALFNEEIKKGWKEIANKFGDARRTKIVNLEQKEDETIEKKSLQIFLTNRNNIFVSEVSSLYTQRRGGVGNKFKTDSGEYVISTATVNSTDEILFFTTDGYYYHCKASQFEIDTKSSLFNLIPIKEKDKVCAFTNIFQKSTSRYILFFTRNGLVKKTDIAEYNIQKNMGMKAITLDEGDEILSIVFTNDDRVGILTETGNFIIIETDDIRAIGRVSRGIKAIKLNDGDKVISARAISPKTKTIVSISGTGLFKQTPINEFTVQTKNTKGTKLQKLTEYDWMADFYPLVDESEILIGCSRSCIKLSVKDIPIYSRGAQGNKSIKLNAQDSVIQLSIY